MILGMAKTCEACLWISSDEAEACERCGAPFDGSLKPQVDTGALGNLVKTAIGLLAVGILGVVGYQQLSGRMPNLGPSLSAGATTFYHWLLGPNEVLKPFLIAALVLPLVVMIVLWVLGRFQ